MKNNKRIIFITSLVILLPIILGFFLWNQLPSKIAIHFNMQGVPDKYDSKTFAVIGIPLTLLAVHFLCILVSRKDFEKAGKKISNLVLWICPVISVVVMVTIFSKNLDNNLNVQLSLWF